MMMAKLSLFGGRDVELINESYPLAIWISCGKINPLTAGGCLKMEGDACVGNSTPSTSLEVCNYRNTSFGRYTFSATIPRLADVERWERGNFTLLK